MPYLLVFLLVASCVSLVVGMIRPGAFKTKGRVMSRKEIAQGAGGLMLVALVGLAFTAVFRPADPPVREAPKTAEATAARQSDPKVCKTVEGYFYSPTKEGFEQLAKLIQAKDETAIRQYMDQGKAGPLGGGMECYLEDRTESGMAKIRLKEMSDAAWTKIEAVDCK